MGAKKGNRVRWVQQGQGWVAVEENPAAPRADCPAWPWGGVMASLALVGGVSGHEGGRRCGRSRQEMRRGMGRRLPPRRVAGGGRMTHDEARAELKHLARPFTALDEIVQRLYAAGLPAPDAVRSHGGGCEIAWGVWPETFHLKARHGHPLRWFAYRKGWPAQTHGEGDADAAVDALRLWLRGGT